jgi:DNA-binding response OmpR family regulator
MSSTARLLVIDDEAGLRLTLACILGDEGYGVTSVASGPEALLALAANDYDLAFLDIRLPEMDGLTVLKEIHRQYPDLSVILITAHASLQSAVEAIRLGATDYLLKPVDPEALVARTRAVLAEQAVLKRRRAIQDQMQALQAEWLALSAEASPIDQRENSREPDRYLRRGALTLDLQTQRVIWRGRAFTLPPTTFDYLAALTRHAPQPAGYQALVAEVQGYQSNLREAQELTRWHIHKLREALEPDLKQPRHILTVRGIGYRLVVD